MLIGISLAISQPRPVIYTFANAEAAALVARFTTQPTNARKALIDTLVGSLKAGSVWSKLDCFYVMAAADEPAAKLNWIADAYNLTESATNPTFTEDRGYQGNGTTSKLLTGFTPSTAGGKFALNSAAFGVWVRTENNGSYLDMGANDGTNLAILRSRNAGQVNFIVNNSTQAVANVASSIGFTSAQRTAASGATSTTAYKNGVSLGDFNSTSVGLPTGQFCLLGRSDNATSINQVSAAAIGNFSGAEHLALYNALNTYLVAVGAA